MRPFSLFSRRSQPQDAQSSRSSRRSSYLSTSSTSSCASEAITLELPNLSPSSYSSSDGASFASGSGVTAQELEDDNMAWGPPRPARRPKCKGTTIAVRSDKSSPIQMAAGTDDKRRL